MLEYETDDIIVLRYDNGVMEIDKRTGIMISWEGVKDDSTRTNP